MSRRKSALLTFERREMMHESFPPLVPVSIPRWRRRVRDAGRSAEPLWLAYRDPGVYRFKLGDYQLTALFDGVWYLPIDDKFVRNASGAEVNQALAAGIPATG